MRPEPRLVHDALGRELRYPHPPRRVVSLCPSQTETLLALGLGERLVGRTRYCIHPAATVAGIAEVGGTKQLRLDALRALAPDLVIAEKEENRREDVDALAAEWPVYVTDVRDIPGALAMIRALGGLCAVEAAAGALADRIEAAFAGLRPLSPPRRCAYLVWRKPWMAAGDDTYISAVLERCGFINVFAGHAGRYPETTPDELAALAPEVLLLSSEPYPFTDAHRAEFSAQLTGSKVLLVDGEAFSWYGARMLVSVTTLQHLLDTLA